MQIDGTPTGVWNILELLLTIIFFLMGFFFIRKYYQGKEKGAKGANDFNIGYAFFFWANALNQFFYIADSIDNFIPSLNHFLGSGEFDVYIGDFDVSLKNQIVLMLFLIILSGTPIMKSIDIYIRKKENAPVYKALLIGAIITGIFYVIFFIINRAIAPDGFNGQSLKFQGQVNTINGIIVNWVVVILMVYIVIITLVVVWYFFIYWGILAIKSPKGAFRTKAFLIFIGILTLYIGLFVGNLLRPDLYDVWGGWAQLMGPSFFLIGMVLLILGFNKEIMD